jgi:hypothetical protein
MGFSFCTMQLQIQFISFDAETNSAQFALSSVVFNLHLAILQERNRAFLYFFVFYNTKSCFANMYNQTKNIPFDSVFNSAHFRTDRLGISSVFKFQKLKKKSGYLY